MKPNITIIHPSRQRSHMALETKKKWLSKAQFPHAIEYILSVDNDDPTLQDYNWAFRNELDTIFDFNNNTTAIQAINNSAKKANGRILIVVSDDFDCFTHWDTFLVESLRGKQNFIVKTADGYGHNSWIITLPIMDDVYYQSFGYIYYPEYHHLWCDTEMTVIAMMTNKIVNLESNEHIFKHNHYTIGGMTKDDISIKNESTWEQGKSLFLSRFDKDFDLEQEKIIKRIDKEKFL